MELNNYDSGLKYDIVSRIAYLIGVRESIFKNEHEPPKIDIYNALECNKPAKIIRNLCIVRNQMEHNFLKICYGIQRDGKTILGMPEYIPTNCLNYLDHNGVNNIYSYLSSPTDFLTNINENIQSRIYNVKSLFPNEVEWAYIADLFIMPNGLTNNGQKAAAEKFYANTLNYPYQCYINMDVTDFHGNLLQNDSYFIGELYKAHHDSSFSWGLAGDVSSHIKNEIYSFIDDSNKCIMIVDCENSSPFSLIAALNSLDQMQIDKISKIVLYDDVNASSAWEILESHTRIPVEYELIERLKDNKSLADVKIVAKICKEFYANNTDSIILVSSDSDYYGMVEELPDAKFLIMLEHEKSSPALKKALLNKKIFYCYLDKFYSAGASELRQEALSRAAAKILRDTVSINVDEIIKEILYSTHINMSDSEYNDFKRSFVNSVYAIVENDVIKLKTKI